MHPRAWVWVSQRGISERGRHDPMCLWAPERKVALLIKFLLKPSAEVDMMGGRWIDAGFCFFP